MGWNPGITYLDIFGIHTFVSGKILGDIALTLFDWSQLLIFSLLLILIIPLLGKHIATIFSDNFTPKFDLLQKIEGISYRVCGLNPKEEMSWKAYALSLLYLNLIGFLFLLLMQLYQNYLPLNPQNLPGVPFPLAFNTAMSFVTNTNWQSYSGETTLSYFVQMAGLTVQNFLSAATGLAAMLALVRGIARKSTNTIGNFWVDLNRAILYLLLPLSFLFAIVLVSEGVIQTFSPYVEITTLEKEKQIIALGPVASQEAIKQLGTNGGGFFNANSAHPFENPSALSNFLETFTLLLIPAASVYAYGIMSGSKQGAWLLLLAMFILWYGGIFLSVYSEHFRNPIMEGYPLLEGKESRFGVANTLLWSVSTTASANGSVNGMISSLSPLAGGVSLFNIMLGELIFGGVGVGLCSMIMFVLLTVFLSGLMVGRTPEYLGKRIEKQEILWVMLAVLGPGALILIGSGFSSISPGALSSLGNSGPHGLTEILYAFSSCSGNNGSAFAGLNANTNYYNFVLALTMLLGRIAILLPSLALAGLLAGKKITPPSSGTFSTNSFLFLILLISVILIVGALTFFPALSLGPLVEQLLMLKGESF